MNPLNRMTRRNWVYGLSGVAALGLLNRSGKAGASMLETKPFADDFRVQHKKIRQSVMGWCYAPMPTEELIDHCQDIGIEGIEGIDSKYYPLATQKGLKIALVSSHGFLDGPVDPNNREACVNKLRESIDLAVRFGAPSVITFTGMAVPGLSREQSDQNCLACWKEVIQYAEKNKITLVLEHLNSRDDSHPMKGHPGYYGDDVDHCIQLVRQMDSAYFKLLFDVYHVQIMNGDVIRRIRAYHPWIGHYHTAGNPGRSEMDEKQEIFYPPILQAILVTGYTGFVAQEYIPTWEDPVKSLRHGAWVMDIE